MAHVVRQRSLQHEGTALAQWPVVAAAAVLHAATLVFGLAALLDLGRTAAGRWLPIVAAFALLAACEGAVLVLLDGALERGARRLPARALRILDAGKALALAALVTVPAASVLKLAATGVHLRRSDLWFAYANLRQLLAEGQPREAAALVALPALALLLAALFFAGLRWCRRRAAGVRPVRVAVGAAAAAVALALAWPRLPGLSSLGGGAVPEIHWLERARRPASAGARRAAPAAPLAETGALPPFVPYRPAPPLRPWNVVFLMLESVSWDLVERRPQAAPNLLRLRDESIAFDRAYAPSTHSDYAQVAILSSLHPRKYAEHDFYIRLAYPRALLWDALAPAGYATAMFSCQNERWGNMLRYLDTPGLAALRHAPDWPRAEHHGEGLESKVFEETAVREWLRWLDGGAREPWFAYLNFQATHFPYQVPAGAPRPWGPAEIDFPASFVSYPRHQVPVMENRFFDALAYSDRWVGEVVEALRRRGQWERTLLVVVSDHGEAFYEHEQPSHGSSLHEEQVRSLWLLRSPERAPRRVVEPVSLLDVAPVILAELGLPPHGNFQGRGDVLAAEYSAAGRPLFFTIQGLVEQDGVLAGDWKLIVDHDRGRRALYSLAQDPSERTDLAPSQPAIVDRLSRELTGFLERQLSYYRQEAWEQGFYPPPLP